MNHFDPKLPKTSHSKLSAFERLSFTQKQNFNVTWQTKLDEIVQEAQLLLPGSLSSKLSEGFKAYDEIKDSEEMPVSASSFRELFFSPHLELCYIDKNREVQVTSAKTSSTSLSCSSTAHATSSSALTPIALPSSALDPWDASLYKASDTFLIQLVQNYLIKDEHSYLKIDTDPLTLDFLLQELMDRNKLILFKSAIKKSSDEVSNNKITVEAPQPSCFITKETTLLEFRLKIEEQSGENLNANDPKPFSWKVWGEFVTSKESHHDVMASDIESLIDLWDIQKSYHSLVLTQSNKIYELKEPNTSVTALVNRLLKQGPLEIPRHELAHFFSKIFNELGNIAYSLAPNIQLIQKTLTPQNILYLKTEGSATIQNPSTYPLQGQIWFRYHKLEVPAQCHQSDQRISVLSHEQSIDPETGTHTLLLEIPDEEVESTSKQQVQELRGVSFDFKRNIFKLDFFYLHDTIASLLETNWEVWAENLKIKLFDQFQCQIRSLTSGFLVEFEDPLTKRRIECWQLIHILKRKSAFIKLDDGTLGVLPQSWIAELQRLYQGYTEEGFFASSAIFNLMDLEETASFALSGDQAYHKMVQDLRQSMSQNDIQFIEPSPHFQGQLLEHQKQGLAWLVLLDKYYLGGLLADEMGLGKSVHVLAFLDYLKEKRRQDKIEKNSESITPLTSLLIAPKSIITQWQDGALSFTPALKVKILKPKELLEAQRESNDQELFLADLVITSYGVARRYHHILKKFHFERIILDEAQVIKNEKSQVSQIVKSFRSSKRLALTGTPIENHIGDFISLLEFLNPGLFPYRVITSSVEEELKSFFQKIKPLILRRKKDDILVNLPKKTEETIVLPLTDSQSEIYLELKRYYTKKLQEPSMQYNFDSQKFYFLEGLLRLRQICCHPQTIFTSHETSLPLNSSKFDFILKKLRQINASEDKVLVFSQFTSFLKLIKTQLESESIPFAYLDGQTEDRKALIDDFQVNPMRKIFLIGLKAGGLGLNLTAANYCFILDPWWNPAVENQAIDRIHRIGQTRDVFVYRLIAQNTIEEKITKLHQMKSKQADFLDFSEKDFLQSLSIDDFKNLF